VKMGLKKRRCSQRILQQFSIRFQQSILINFSSQSSHLQFYSNSKQQTFLTYLILFSYMQFIHELIYWLENVLMRSAGPCLQLSSKLDTWMGLDPIETIVYILYVVYYV
jgi:hypothetical protein